ncbi:MAG: hypothetical protein HRU26_05385, partial [Psychroserpens sp.]|nr:hypothetical protein [Psychroserpens sp.]
LQINPIDTFPDIGQQTVCDTDQDGLTTVDLSSYNDQIVQGQTGYSISYFNSLQDAEADANEIGHIYSNTANPFTVYVRITSQATSCTDISSFEILVNPAPEANDANPFVICDDDQDGFFNVNLEDKIPEIVSDLTNREIEFYETISDANTQENEIDTPTNYSANTGTIYVRVINATTGCISIRTIPIIVNTLPVFTDISDFIFCENNTDNIGDFLLSSKDSEILNGQTGKEVLYFISEDDAINNSNAIDKNSNYENTINPETIFVRVQNITDTDCYGISSFILSVGTNPEFNAPIDIFTCDDGSNDGRITIDLNEKSTEIMAGFTEDVTITYFANLNDLNNNTNAIIGDTYDNITNPQEIFARIENETTCFSITSFTVNVIPVPTVTEILPFEACDIDYDESISWDLTAAEINILDIRQDNVVVSYFVTENDADLDSNAIQNPTDFVNTSNPQIVFVKVTNTDFNCPIVLPIELNVISPPEFNDFGTAVICENDDSSYDLNDITVLLGDNSQAVEITYYTNEQDAINTTNHLDTEYTYQSNSDILFARIENTFTTCFYIYPFMIEVNERPSAGIAEN